MGRLFAAAIATAWLPPLAASVGTVAFNNLGVEPPAAVLLWSLVVAAGIWLLATISYSPFTSAKRSNPRSYSLLINRIDGLHTLRATICNQSRGRAASICADAKAKLDEVTACLTRTDPRWVTGTGYIAAWEAVHRVEESLVDNFEKYDLLEGARHDILRLQGSSLPHRDDLLKLARSAEAYLTGGKSGGPTMRNIEEARKAVKEVRSNVNVFRDSSWNGLVVLANQTMTTLVIMHIIAFGLLAGAILGGAGKADQVIEAAAVFFLVGAATGVFNRLYVQSQTDTAVDDYGLAMARLLTVPAFSGLAAIGGVLLTTLTAAHATSTNLASIFEFKNHPLVLLDAAAFGLTPALLVQGVAKRSQKYQSDIRSTEPTDGASNSASGN